MDETTCTHDCAACGEDCPSRAKPQSLQEAPNALSRIGHVLAVVSGKGGVGKSLVTSALAVQLTEEDAAWLEEPYVPHRVVGAINSNPPQGVMLLDVKK